MPQWGGAAGDVSEEESSDESFEGSSEGDEDVDAEEESIPDESQREFYSWKLEAYVLRIRLQ